MIRAFQARHKKNKTSRHFMWGNFNYNNREKYPTPKHAKKKRHREMCKRDNIELP